MPQTITPNTILILSSYPPRACGIATYTQDMRNALSARFDASFDVQVCALQEELPDWNYPREVTDTVDVTSRLALMRKAEDINRDRHIAAVCIQHEFGLYSGDYGSYLLSFLEALDKPAVGTFHTVLPHPDPERL